MNIIKYKGFTIEKKSEERRIESRGYDKNTIEISYYTWTRFYVETCEFRTLDLAKRYINLTQRKKDKKYKKIQQITKEKIKLLKKLEKEIERNERYLEGR